MQIVIESTPVIFLQVKGDEEFVRRIRNFCTNNRISPISAFYAVNNSFGGHYRPEDAQRITEFADSIKLFFTNRNVKNGTPCTINEEVPKWAGTKGVVEDAIPNTDPLWYNVRVINHDSKCLVGDTENQTMRLVLRADEFTTE
jgi:hypothetical protein